MQLVADWVRTIDDQLRPLGISWIRYSKPQCVVHAANSINFQWKVLSSASLPELPLSSESLSLDADLLCPVNPIMCDGQQRKLSHSRSIKGPAHENPEIKPQSWKESGLIHGHLLKMRHNQRVIANVYIPAKGRTVSSDMPSMHVVLHQILWSRLRKPHPTSRKLRCLHTRVEMSTWTTKQMMRMWVHLPTGYQCIDHWQAAIPDKLQSRKQRALDILMIFSDRCTVKFSHREKGTVETLTGHWCNECRSVLIQLITCIGSGLTCDNAGKMWNSWQSMGNERLSILVVTPRVASTFGAIMNCIKFDVPNRESKNTITHYHESWGQNKRPSWRKYS